MLLLPSKYFNTRPGCYFVGLGAEHNAYSTFLVAGVEVKPWPAAHLSEATPPRQTAEFATTLGCRTPRSFLRNSKPTAYCMC